MSDSPDKAGFSCASKVRSKSLLSSERPGRVARQARSQQVVDVGFEIYPSALSYMTRASSLNQMAGFYLSVGEMEQGPGAVGAGFGH